jgi:hypothetical protein
MPDAFSDNIYNPPLRREAQKPLVSLNHLSRQVLAWRFAEAFAFKCRTVQACQSGVTHDVAFVAAFVQKGNYHVERYTAAYTRSRSAA